MAVSAESVIWAYRLLLGREPESDDVINKHMNAASQKILVENFMRSGEFSSKFPLTKPSVRHLNTRSIDIQVKCTDSELNTMLTRIALGWKNLADSQPHWSVLTNELFLEKNIDQNIEHFYETGRSWISVVLATLERNNVDCSALHSVLDFGCGVGRLTLALAEHFKHVHGIDISHGHLALARQRAAQTGFDNVQFSAVQDFGALAAVEPYDFLVSFIVLQHNPPPIIAFTLDLLLSKLRPGGVAIFQVPTFANGYTFSVRDYLDSPRRDMEMNVLPQKELFSVIAKQDCRVLEVREDNLAGSPRYVSQRFLLQKQA